MTSTAERSVKRAPVSHIREHEEIVDADLQILRDMRPGDCRVLDIGAGPGTFVARASRWGIDAVGLDIEMSAREVWASRGIACVLGDGFVLPFRPNSFDVVRLKDVIEHVQNPLGLLVSACSVLREGGIVLAHVPSPYSQLFPVANFWDDYTHVRPLTKAGLRRLFADAGLDVLRVSGYVAGRNRLERFVGGVMGRFVPHSYRIIGRRAWTSIP